MLLLLPLAAASPLYKVAAAVVYLMLLQLCCVWCDVVELGDCRIAAVPATIVTVHCS